MKQARLLAHATDGVRHTLKRSSIIWAQRRVVTGVECSRLGLQFTSISHTFRAWSTTKSYPNSSWLLGLACKLSCIPHHADAASPSVTGQQDYQAMDVEHCIGSGPMTCLIRTSHEREVV